MKAHSIFIILNFLTLLILFTLLRLGLLAYNYELAESTSLGNLAEALLNGLRFDARVAVIICAPLIFAFSSVRAFSSRRWQTLWLISFTSLVIFFGVVELDFYQEFHQRLNGLVFQYLKEDPATVLSMLWYGFPIVRLLLAWLLISYVMFVLFTKIDRATSTKAFSQKNNQEQQQFGNSWPIRSLALVMCLILAVIAGRGTLRQGAPLRWGDAFTTESMFANQLGLNGILTLSKALEDQFTSHRENQWQATMPADEATAITRKLLLSPQDLLINSESAAVRRIYKTAANKQLPIRNVVVILMESFAGHFVGALGSQENITPYFDRLAQEGLLFTQFFSNGTHTHQGMFATMACFPNLPAFEYLMQTSEGGNLFSGLPQLLSARQYNDVYVYNGDFAWDNQRGFFSNQGMRHFVGRNDFINPVVSDPTWGVSDQDMFDRAAQELLKINSEKNPFYALLQTLSNHTPYALPDKLPVEVVTDHGSLNLHLTAMRYSDWALGQFFEKARKSPYFNDTLFVVVGDHGFGAHEQLTEIDLFRFHIPMLLIAPGIRESFGDTTNIVGSQVDVVPTIMGRLSGTTQHQCWGRDLLNLEAEDPGFAIIKPSGSDQTVAMIRGDYILVKPKDMPAHSYQYKLGENSSATRIEHPDGQIAKLKQLEAYLQTATTSLLANTAGVRDSEDGLIIAQVLLNQQRLEKTRSSPVGSTNFILMNDKAD